MPVFQKLVNFNEMFMKLSEPPIIINTLVNNSEEDKEAIKELVTTRFSSDMISLMPACRCKMTKGEYSIGVICPFCKTTVQSSIEDDIEPVVWFKRPIGVAPLISPIVWIMLKARFRQSGFNIIQWLTDTGYHPQVRQPAVLNKIIETGIQRGYNYFVENFDTIMSYLFSLKEYRKKEEDYLKILIEKNRDCIFSDYIPIPNKSLLIIEKTNVGVYVDNIIVEAIDAIQMLVSIDLNFHDQSTRVKENRTAKALSHLSDFYERFYDKSLGKKTGQFRRHIFGTRTNFSFRAVITSLTDTHSYEEIHVPWGVGVTAFRPHLLNKLLKMGMDLNSALGLMSGHVEKYHPLLDQLLKELIAESPEGRIPVLLQRNPSLLQGSALRLGISRFKTDPSDHTIGVSILIVKPLNADFDGDAVNVSIALDKHMADMWYALHPKFNILQLGEPFDVSNCLAIPKPCVSTQDSWINS